MFAAVARQVEPVFLFVFVLAIVGALLAAVEGIRTRFEQLLPIAVAILGVALAVLAAKLAWP